MIAGNFGELGEDRRVRHLVEASRLDAEDVEEAVWGFSREDLLVERDRAGGDVGRKWRLEGGQSDVEVRYCHGGGGGKGCEGVEEKEERGVARDSGMMGRWGRGQSVENHGHVHAIELGAVGFNELEKGQGIGR